MEWLLLCERVRETDREGDHYFGKFTESAIIKLTNFAETPGDFQYFTMKSAEFASVYVNVP